MHKLEIMTDDFILEIKDCVNNGKNFHISNDDYSIDVYRDYDSSSSLKYFLWFNGKIVKLTKGWNSIQKKIKELHENYSFELFKIESR